jgi:hypothetical protein
MKNNNLPQLVKDTCHKYGINPDDSLWNCHGTWVMYHRALERVAALQNITFNQPTIIEHNAEKRICVMLVKGTWQGKEEWTIGEAMPINIDRKNNQQQYPFAMAEKRAKDRVILKLLGLHGYVYSQEEFADAESDLQKNKSNPKPDPKPKTEVKDQGEWEKIHATYMKNITEFPSQAVCNFWFNKHKDVLKSMKTAVPRMYGEIEEHYTKKLNSLQP